MHPEYDGITNEREIILHLRDKVGPGKQYLVELAPVTEIIGLPVIMTPKYLTTL